MFANLRPALVLLLLFTVLTGLVYPLGITAIASLAFSEQAGGSLLRQGDRIVGSRLIGQDFRSGRYFWPRPSATGDTPYNAAASSGTNLGPTSARLRDMVATAVTRVRNAGITVPLPADSVTASGSGLDPHISPAFARLQVARIAGMRGLSVAEVDALVARYTEIPFLGTFGEPRVNVLALNMALDSAGPRG